MRERSLGYWQLRALEGTDGLIGGKRYRNCFADPHGTGPVSMAK